MNLAFCQVATQPIHSDSGADVTPVSGPEFYCPQDRNDVLKYRREEDSLLTELTTVFQLY